MDATIAPHRIPPEMPQYGEENHIFELMQVLTTWVSALHPQNMLEQLLIHQPEDPIPFMIQHLHRDNDNVPRIVILGPPASGKTTIAMWLCKHLNSSLLTLENLILNEFSYTATEARRLYLQRKTVPSALLVQLIQERLAEEDCIKQGWILDGIPETREQALRIQTLGITPRHVIVLSAPDTVLIERNLGKRIDPQTGEIYHTTFDWPPESEIQNRLMVPEDISELETAQKLLEYHRNIVRVIPSYPKILKVISADQPCVDVFYQALTYVQSNHRTNAPFTPRVLLLGPVGSGKSLQAALLAQKYRLVNVCCGQLLKEAVADRTTFGELIQPFFEKEMAVPDSLLMKVLSQRLDQQDCIQKGWVLHGVPRDLDQAHLLNRLGYNPNRVFFLNVPFDSIMERLTLRRIDPVTGERYHLMYKPPPTMEIQARLLQNPKDAEEQVKLKMDLFYRNSADLEQLYGSAITLNGDQDPYTVFEYIESGIINPLPKKIP
ncbi:adenylate kinase 8 isoform X1 [Homo sapiens]|nr:adenylate kinase 8 isoform X1 [Homo sapiens]XP_054218030.1 adenylate kinase 8 isoform X1 [Homo sapiens]|eukprot:XP_005272226.1 adenylate kinase 8 isoform X1 [Homo sapiens]